MGNITITFPDGSKKEFEKGVRGIDIVRGISEGLAREALCAKINGRLVDLSEPVTEDSSFSALTFKDREGKEVFWHSSAHLLAQAVTSLFPYAKPTIGPALEEGFYYDFDHDAFTEEQIKQIEEKAMEIAKQKLEIKRIEAGKKEVLELFRDNPYKVELLNEAEGNISLYQQGEFIDLCRGPHIQNTGQIKAFKILKVGGAYWKGNQQNKQLQRLYGISFPDKKEMKKFLANLEEAKKRDHRKIGKQNGLFMMHELSLSGCPFILPKGTVVYNEILNFIRKEYFKRGYQEVITPQIFKKELWEKSGHWQHYKENMFVMDINGHEYSLKPMNCPSHLLIYNSKTRSYRDLPLRIADFCYLHRNELEGVLGGLTRVVKFAQDDAHIFLMPEQIESEILGLLDFIKYVYKDVFGFEYSVKLSTKPEDSMGEQELWDKAEDGLKKALKKAGMEFVVKEGEGAFYGPKIDFDVKDALGREWQLATIQLDFQLPLRFNATYEGKDGQKHTVVMVHRAIFGSIERFMAVLIEHFAGKFPLWLAPVQVKVLSIADRHNDYVEEIASALKEKGIRAEKDTRAETTNKKVREAQLQKIPYVLIVGDKEMEKKTISVRTLDGEVVFDVKLKEFADRILDIISNKKLEWKY